MQNQTIFGPFFPIQSYFGQSGKTDYFGTIWGQREETLLPVVILTFSQENEAIQMFVTQKVFAQY